MNISVNDIFEPVTEFSVFTTLTRVLHLDDEHDAAIVIDLVEPPRKPYPVGIEELRLSLETGDTKSVVTKVPEFLLVLEDDLDESSKRDRDEKWAVIAPLLDPAYPGQIFVRGEMGRLVGNRAAELGMHRKSIYRLLYRYWFYGQVRNALLKIIQRWVLPTEITLRINDPALSLSFRETWSHPPSCSLLSINGVFE